MISSFNHNRSMLKRRNYKRLKNKFRIEAKGRHIDLKKATDGEMKDLRRKVEQLQSEEKRQNINITIICAIIGPILLWGLVFLMKLMLNG